MVKVSPLAPGSFPGLPPVDGVRIATAAAGIRYKNRQDVLVMLFDKGTTAAGVFTRSKCPSAAVDWCRDILASGKARALMVNSGNANAFTGKKGKAATKLSGQLLAKAAGCRPGDIYLCSTGVIGEPLPADRFSGVVDELVASAQPDGWEMAARAIMTTDTFPKGATALVDLGGVPVRINGIAKGAGMIAPDMATMLSFVATDAPLDASVMQAMLATAVKDTFNAITIDSDTSTSDTLLFFATGKAKGAPRISDPADLRLRSFKAALKGILAQLSQLVVRDGEGARKLVEINVTGATTKRSARRIAMSIANSPLVKTAIAGEDANWGRIVMAVGKAGEPADRDRLAIFFGDIRVAYEGERDPAYSEEATSTYMKKPEIAITVDIGLGKGRDRVWTCDLTKEYVEINGDYRS
ncbi:MAG: bifunctional glutamate N-acetyltransferase/amino-acid acetyltransferase ArgJ [Bauldia sp.]|nr:bifunctional glutamate N-acetyltransferase/amino-acid acetyltransferase ArgJ [Bauldia sp.]